MTKQIKIEVLNSLALDKKSSVFAVTLGVGIHVVDSLQATQVQTISKLEIQCEEQQNDN